MRNVGEPNSLRVACNDDGDHVCEAAAGRQVAARRCRITDQVVHPADEHVFHPHSTRARIEHAGVFIKNISQIIAEGGIINTAAGNICEMSAGCRIKPGLSTYSSDQRDRLGRCQCRFPLSANRKG